jgi:virginiamycin B lyase
MTVAPDGAVWALATGRDRVYRVAADGHAEAWQLPSSGLGFQLSVARDGTAWLPERYRDAIASISPGGAVTECRLRRGAEPVMPLALDDGTVWVSEFSGNGLARLRNGTFTEFKLTGAARGITELAPDGTGGVWATESKADAILHADSAGQLTEVSLSHAGAFPIGVLTARGGTVWFAEFGGDRLGHLAGAAAPTFVQVAAGSGPQGLVQASDGSIWFTESKSDRIGRLRPDGTIELPVTVPADAWPDHLGITPDGWIWWTEYNSGRLARMKLPA